MQDLQPRLSCPPPGGRARDEAADGMPTAYAPAAALNVSNLQSSIYSNKFLFGDEGPSNLLGSALLEMVVTGTPRSIACSFANSSCLLLATSSVVEHVYSGSGLYNASFKGCCRQWTRLINSIGYGWAITSSVLVQDDFLSKSSPSLFPLARSPYVPWVAEVAASSSTASQFYVQGFHSLRSASPQSCIAGGSGGGCRFRYRLLSDDERRSTNPAAAPSSMPGGITVNANTGLITVNPAAFSSSITATKTVVNLVLYVEAGGFPPPWSAETLFVVVDFCLVLQSVSPPTLTGPSLMSTVDWIPGMQVID